MGSATCHELAKRGCKVLGLEQFGIPNENGSSGGEPRLIRLAYFEHPDYIPLLQKTYRLWDELSERTGEKQVTLTGGVYLGPEDGVLVSGVVKAAEKYQLGVERLDRAEVVQRCGPFVVPEDYTAVYEAEMGFIRPQEAIAAFAKLAVEHGAVLHTEETVTDWSADCSGVRVRTNRDEYTAAKLAFCAGAWTAPLLCDIGVRLEVTRQVMFWVSPKTNLETFRCPPFGCWAVEEDAPGREGVYYGFPMLSDHTGMKLGCHEPGSSTSPEALQRTVTDSDEHTVRATLERFLPGANGPLVSAKVCMYTLSPDEHFIVDKYPLHENVVIACGFSGHGFKFAPVVGEALADLALNGESKLPIGFLRLNRFR